MILKRKSENHLTEIKSQASFPKADAKIVRTCLSKLKEKQLVESNKQWETPIIVLQEPNPYTIPEELLRFTPTEAEIHKYFFRKTANEVVIRQIFLHTPLTDAEQGYLKEFRLFCKSHDYAIPAQLEPMLLRVLWYNIRKFGQDNYFVKSLMQIQEMHSWRVNYFSLSDSAPELREDLDKGIMYWVGRDSALRPLLIVVLSRAIKNLSIDRFEKLTIFCFEWALRYLMLPGRVETCTVLVDLRDVSFFQIPVSTLKSMINTLTKQYPFRLSKMWIIHEITLMQALWNIAKQFLTEVQQAKIAIYRNNIEKDLIKEYPLNQLEQKYGGLRPEIKIFYPFPLVPGPFEVGSSKESNALAYKNGWKACDNNTAIGVLWEGDVRTPIQWSDEAHHVFADLGLVPSLSTSSVSNEEFVDSSASHLFEKKRSLVCKTEGDKEIEAENITNFNCGTSTAESKKTIKRSAHSSKFLGPSSHSLSPPTAKATDNNVLHATSLISSYDECINDSKEMDIIVKQNIEVLKSISTDKIKSKESSLNIIDTNNKEEDIINELGENSFNENKKNVSLNTKRYKVKNKNCCNHCYLQ